MLDPEGQSRAFELQALSLDVPYQLVRMVPYLATMVVLPVTSGRSATGIRWGG